MLPINEWWKQKEQGNGTYLLIMKDQIVYYLGPTPNREGQVIGSAGPTTSSRMDKYAPTLTWTQGLDRYDRKRKKK